MVINSIFSCIFCELIISISLSRLESQCFEKTSEYKVLTSLQTNFTRKKGAKPGLPANKLCIKHDVGCISQPTQ